MGRRSNGEGTLFQRKDGRWSAQTYVTLTNGTTKRICITNRDRNIVKTKLQEALSNEQRKISYIEKDWKISDYLDYWMKEVQPKRIRETTIYTYSVAIRKHIKPVLGGHKLKSLTVHDVRTAMSELENRDCPAAMRKKCMEVLSSCITCAMREDLVFRNVAQLAEAPKYAPKETTIWTAAQAALFLRSVKEHPHYVAFLLLLTYGMRRGEVVGLRWCDIDFDNRTIYVKQQIDRINGVIKARELKTKNSRRQLPLVDKVFAALVEYAKKNDIITARFNPQADLTVEGTIITSSVGTPLEPRNLNRSFHQLTEKIGLPRIKIHATRHTIATILKELAVPLKDVQLILGHSNITTTANIYQHGTSEVQRAALTSAQNRLLSENSEVRYNTAS